MRKNTKKQTAYLSKGGYARYPLKLSFLCKAISAEYGPAISWLEGDFALLSALGTNCLVHLSWPEISTFG
jgi:hypothetical protein